MPGITLRLGKRSHRKGEVVWLEGTDLVIGRGRDCALTLTSDAVSRHHCRIRLDGDRWLASDEGSQNGVFLNKMQIHTAEIRAGDDLLLGPAGPHVEVLALDPAPGVVDPAEAPTRAVRLPHKRSDRARGELPSLEPLPTDPPPKPARPRATPRREPPPRKRTPPKQAKPNPPPPRKAAKPKARKTAAARPAAAASPPPASPPPAPPQYASPAHAQHWPPPQATPSPASSGPRVGRWFLLLVVIGAAAAAYVERERLPEHFAYVRGRLSEWTSARSGPSTPTTDAPGDPLSGSEATQPDGPPPPPTVSEPAGPMRTVEAAADGGYCFLELVTTAYSRSGKQPGERLDVVVTTEFLPARVSSVRTAEDALADARAALAVTEAPDEAEVRAWLDQPTGRDLVISRKIEPSTRAPFAELDPARPAEPRRDVQEGAGPSW